MTQDGSAIYCSPSEQRDGEDAVIMVLVPGEGSAAKQLVLECQRIASIYNGLAARVQSQIWLFDASPETTGLYITCIRRFELLVGNPTLAEMTTEMLARFRDLLLAARRYATVKVLSAHTVRMYVRHIQYLLDCAGPPVHKSRDRAGFIDVVPYCKPPRAELPEPKIVKADLLSACYEAAGSMETPRGFGVDPPAWWRALLVVTYNVGLRRRTLFAMEWRHVDFREGTLRLPAEIMKSRKRLLLPMNDIVRRHLLAIRSDEEKVFPRPFSRERFGFYFRQLQATAGVMGNEKFGLHTLRKTCATTLFQEDAQAAQLMLGHAAISVTQSHYINAVAALRDSVSRMPQPKGFDTVDVRPSVIAKAENDAAIDWL
jgi:integrase